jgi:hypothetical protein
MIIGVSGKAGVGKTTLGEVAVTEFGFTRVAFGSLLKADLIDFMHKAEFVFNPEHFYMTSVEKNILIPVPVAGQLSIDDYNSLRHFTVMSPTCHRVSISYRSLMQWYGDKTRATNKDYWLQRFIDTTDFSEDVIVDDVRFTSEAALIHALGGILVRINWPTRTGNSTHVSETNLDSFPIFDSVIDKDHSLSLDEFTNVCREHMKLFLGDLDEPIKPAELNP